MIMKLKNTFDEFSRRSATTVAEPLRGSRFASRRDAATLASDCATFAERKATLNRRGFSIIEVLTSIVVAMIGVFGVMVLIPFAVRQTQTGLNLDDSYNLGQNVADEFHMLGYTNPESWAGDDQDVDELLGITGENLLDAGGAPVLDGSGNAIVIPRVWNVRDNSNQPFILQPRPVVIDPQALEQTRNITTGLIDSEAAIFPFRYLNVDPGSGNDFPDFHAGTSPEHWTDLVFHPITLKNSTGVGILSPEQVINLFRSGDDVVFVSPPEPDADQLSDGLEALAPPNQEFVRVANIPVRPATNGSISWAGLIIPNKNQNSPSPIPTTTNTNFQTTPSSFTMHMMVFKDRVFNFAEPLDPTFPHGQMAVAKVLVDQVDVDNDLTGLVSPLTRVSLDLPAGISLAGVRKDDWVMLINRRRNTGVYDFDGGAVRNDMEIPIKTGAPDPNSQYAEIGYDRQIAFYRVRGISEAVGTTLPASIDVDGPGFNFGLAPGNPNSGPRDMYSDTWVVHLKGVVNVYERTYSFEQAGTPWLPR